MTDELRDQIAEKLNSTIVTSEGDLAPAADRFDRHDRHRFLHNCVVCRGDVAVIAEVAWSVVEPRLSEAMAEAERLRGAFEIAARALRSDIEAKAERARRAETAIEQALKIAERLRTWYNDPNLSHKRGDALIGDLLAALNPAGGSEKGCCDECAGSGYSGDTDVPGGACWTCQGTGHPHDGPCVPAGGSEETKEDPNG